MRILQIIKTEPSAMEYMVQFADLDEINITQVDYLTVENMESNIRDEKYVAVLLNGADFALRRDIIELNDILISNILDDENGFIVDVGDEKDPIKLSKNEDRTENIIQFKGDIVYSNRGEFKEVLADYNIINPKLRFNLDTINDVKIRNMIEGYTEYKRTGEQKYLDIHKKYYNPEYLPQLKQFINGN